VNFSNIPFGTYTLKVEQPQTIPYHQINSDTYTLTVNSDGTYTIEDESAKPILENKVISLADKGSVSVVIYVTGTDIPLANASFKLVDDFGVVHGTGLTDANGLISFSNLPLGMTYALHEENQNNQYQNSPSISIMLVPQTVVDPNTGLQTVVNHVEVPWPKTPMPVLPSSTTSSTVPETTTSVATTAPSATAPSVTTTASNTTSTDTSAEETTTTTQTSATQTTTSESSNPVSVTTTTEKKSAAPKTGDESRLTLWIFLLVTTVTVTCLIGVKRKKQMKK